MSELRVRGLRKSFFYGMTEKVIIPSLSVVFKKGYSYGLCGKSGAGKSTFLHLLAGIEQPTEGEIFYDDLLVESIESEARSSFASLILQKPFFLKGYTVFENCLIVAKIHRQPYEKAAKEIDLLLKKVGLISYKKEEVGVLSGGQQQRLSLVRTLLIRPAFILADELTSSMDGITAYECMQLLKRICKEYKIGLIFSTHNEKLAQEMDYCFTLENGILLQQK